MSRNSPFSYFLRHSATSFRSKRSSALCSSIVSISSLSRAVLEEGGGGDAALFSFVIYPLLHVRERHSAAIIDRQFRMELHFLPRLMAAATRASSSCRCPSTTGRGSSAPRRPSRAPAFSPVCARAEFRFVQDKRSDGPAPTPSRRLPAPLSQLRSERAESIRPGQTSPLLPSPPAPDS